LLVGALVLITAVSSAPAQSTYPARPVTLLVGYPPGGLSDLTARAIAKAAEKTLGQPIIVMNKPGASSSLQMGLLAQAKPDGYTIGYMPAAAVAVLPHVQTVNYDPTRDFTPIVNLFNYAAALVVREDAPWKSVQQFVEYARQNPGQVKYGTYGAHGTTTLVMEAWAKQIGVKWDTVPFKSDAEAVTGLLGGHITAAASASVYAQHARGGKLRILAFLGEGKAPDYQAVPTLKELGHPLVAEGFVGIGGPKGLPEPLVTRLEEAFVQATRNEEYQAVVAKFALANQVMRAREFAAFLRQTFDFHGELIKKANIKP
jgi:tripartite-type tricarboxylate transporter receptor subunit TctC